MVRIVSNEEHDRIYWEKLAKRAFEYYNPNHDWISLSEEKKELCREMVKDHRVNDEDSFKQVAS